MWGMGDVNQEYKALINVNKGFCTILGIIKIIKRGECRCRGLYLTKNHLKMEKKTKKEEKKRKNKLCSERDLNPRPSDYKSCT